MSKSDESAAVVVGCLMAIILLAICGAISGFTLQYTVNTWLVYVGKPATFPFIVGFLIGCIPRLGSRLFLSLSILAAIGTFIAKFFL